MHKLGLCLMIVGLSISGVCGVAFAGEPGAKGASESVDAANLKATAIPKAGSRITGKIKGVPKLKPVTGIRVQRADVAEKFKAKMRTKDANVETNDGDADVDLEGTGSVKKKGGKVQIKQDGVGSIDIDE